MKKRPVEIVMLKDFYSVKYLDRKKGQRHSAAQFWAKSYTFNQVITWVQKQPKLLLVEKIHEQV